MAVDEQRLEQLFEAALACRDETERLALIDAVCAGDPELRRRAQRLLSAHMEMNGFLETPSANLVPMLTGVDDSAPRPEDATGSEHDPCTQIGTVIARRYRLVRFIGEGGMGTVYAAEQCEPVQRTVALKLLHHGLETASVLRRFRTEQQSLAMMEHPNIARIFDGGTTEDGRPYFAMEYFPAEPITRYCDRTRAGVRERIELFIAVCGAVQHAHQKGIIHRDLKPGNILVAQIDGKPVPKIIDFGVAKAVARPLNGQTLATGLGTIVGTPEYMSPEQADLGQDAIDTRTDVYALGVVLYELLAGSVPFSGSLRRDDSLFEVLRQIREDEPPPPSSRVAKTDDSAMVATARGTRVGRLAHVIKGELDAIVLKCLEKSVERRYATAQELADDLGNYLAGLPIKARSKGRIGAIVGYCRRRPTIAGLVASVVASLLIGLCVSTFFAVAESRRAVTEHHAREDAETQRRLAEREHAEGQRQLARAYVSEARALRVSNRTGQRFAALRAIENALRITGPTRELADEAAAALSLPDWEVGLEWPGYPPDTTTFALSPTFDRYARVNEVGKLSIRSLPADRELASIDVSGHHCDYGGLRFGPRGKLLFELIDQPRRMGRVWALSQTRPNLVCETDASWIVADPTERTLAISRGTCVELWDVATRSHVKSIPIDRDMNDAYFDWNPLRNSLVIAFRDEWRTLDLETGQLGPKRPLNTTRAGWPNVYPNGQWVAMPTNLAPFHVFTLNIETHLWIGTPFQGHRAPGAIVQLSNSGDIAFSNDWHHVLRMWEPRTGRALMSRPSQNRSGIVVSTDDRRVGPEIVGNTVRLLRFCGSREHGQLGMSWDGAALVPVEADSYHAFAPDGRLMAFTSARGIVFIDLLAGVVVGFWPSRGLAEIQVVRFLADGSLVTYGVQGWMRWPLTRDNNNGQLSFGPPQRYISFYSIGPKPYWPSAAPDGCVVCVQNGLDVGGARVYRLSPELGVVEKEFPVRLGSDVRSVSVSPDGRFAATGVHSGVVGDMAHGAHVWDTSTGLLVVALDSRPLCRVEFSPRGSRLVTHSGDNMECRVYQVGSWSLAASFQASHPGIFSPDESLFAVGLTPGVLALCHGADFQEFARLWNPAGNPVVPLFMTPDNSRLIAADTETNQLMFWDLGLLRKGLADLGLAAGWPDIRVSHNSTVQPIQVAKQHVLTESQSETVRSDSSAPKSQ